MKKYMLLSILIALLAGCEDDMKLPDREYYILVTDAPQIDEQGVTFTASFEVEGEEPIREKGFYIKRDFTTEPPAVETHIISEEGFYLRIEEDWKEGVTCYVQAFIQTEKSYYVGEEVAFTP